MMRKLTFTQMIFKNKDFSGLFWVQFFGAFNDNIFKNALVILLVYKNIEILGLQSSSLVALASALFMLPFFLFSAKAGILADYVPKKKLIIYVKVAEIMIMLLAAIGIYFDNFEMLLLVLFLMGAQSAYFGPVKYSILPRLVHRDNLLTANALINTATFAAILLGTILGGVVAADNHYHLYFSIFPLIFAFIGLFISFFIPNIQSNESKKNDSLIKILSYGVKDKKIFYKILGISWFWLYGACLLTLIPELSKDIFKADEFVTTFFLTCFTLGMGIGGIIIDKISKRNIELGCISLCCLGMGLFACDFYFISTSLFIEKITINNFYNNMDLIRASFDFLMISILGGMYIVPQFAYIQLNSKANILSRIIASLNIWNALFMVTGSILIMLARTNGFEIGEIFLGLGISSIFASVLLFKALPLYTLRIIIVTLARIFYKVEIVGREKINRDKGGLILSNHISYIDWAFVFTAFGRPARIIIDNDYYKIKWFTWLFKLGELVPIARGKESEEIKEKAFSDVRESLSNGDAISIFPEGHISRNGEMGRFMRGTTRILNETKSDFYIFSIKGLWGSIFSHKGGKFFFKFPETFRRKITVTIQGPFSYDLYDSKKSHQMMKDYI